MKFRCPTATAALMALSVPSMAGADDKLKYDDLIHCAATNMVVAGVLSLDDGKTANKDQIETFNGQAAALMAIASIGSKQETAAVMADTSKESDAIIAVLGDKEKSKGFIDTELPRCNTLGQAAIQVMNGPKTGK